MSIAVSRRSEEGSKTSLILKLATGHENREPMPQWEGALQTLDNANYLFDPFPIRVTNSYFKPTHLKCPRKRSLVTARLPRAVFIGVRVLSEREASGRSQRKCNE
jgi:hypothetical protein